MNAVVQYQVSDMERMAKAFAASKLFGIQNVEQALALCLVAQAEGRHPASAAADYHIMNGKPSKKAEAMLRDFVSAGGKVEWHKLDDNCADATFSHPSGSARIEWTIERAKRAGLTTAMWTKYPRQMLRSRVVSEGVRTVYPMATSGMYVPEEVADFAPDPKSQEAPPAAIAEMRDVTPRDEPTPPQQAPAGEGNGVKRLNSAQAKRIGLSEKIGAAIWACATRTELAEWDANFDEHTAEAPLSWLDSIRNDVILRGEAIDKELMFRAPSEDGISGRISDMDATGDDYLTRQFKASIEHEAAKAHA